MDPGTSRHDDLAPFPWWGLAAAGFALFAVAVELTSSAFANTPVPAWLEALAPLGWPTAARVSWWVAVAAAVGTFHAATASVGQRRHPALVVASVLPFLGFAVGVAIGAEWASWH